MRTKQVGYICVLISKYLTIIDITPCLYQDACYNRYIDINKDEENKMETMVTYSNNNNPFDLVLIKSDDSFVIVGDSVPSDVDLEKMVNWEDVSGWVGA